MRFLAPFLLLNLWFAGSAAALGLGELNVRSALGQPLYATIRILDPDATVNADCFHILPAEGGLNAPLRPQLRLEASGDSALLHLRTAQSVNDPIVQFVLVSECGVNLRREYVVLLDPPAVDALPVVNDPAPRLLPDASPAPADKPPLRAARPATPPASSVRPAVPRPRATASDSRPRLVLSGRRMASRSPDAFALKLDTTLPDLDRPRSPTLTATELSDENTALTRKLAHLEAQLVELQRRNAELEARRPAAPVVPPAPAPGRARWPWMLLGLGLLAGLVLAVAWLRRRSRERAASYALEDWTLPAPLGEPDVRETPPAPVPEAAEQEAPPDDMAEIPRPPQEEATEVKDDILDQAEVYMAHGHSDLAIHLLREHLREAPTESPVPWLLLLDLLQRDGDLDGYAQACAECRKHFNINLADQPASNEADLGEGLEAYPHLLDRLVAVWRAPDIDTFFNDLIYDNRGGTRIGFAPAAYREILMLRAIAQDVREAA